MLTVTQSPPLIRRLNTSLNHLTTLKSALEVEMLPRLLGTAAVLANHYPKSGLFLSEWLVIQSVTIRRLFVI